MSDQFQLLQREQSRQEGLTCTSRVVTGGRLGESSSARATYRKVFE